MLYFFNVRNTQRVFLFICLFLKNSYQLPSVAFFMYSQYWGAIRTMARRDQGRSQSEEDRRLPNRSQILCLQNGLPVTVSALAVGWGMDKETSELLLQTSQVINNLGFVDNGISGINLNSAFLIVIHL